MAAYNLHKWGFIFETSLYNNLCCKATCKLIKKYMNTLLKMANNEKKERNILQAAVLCTFVLVQWLLPQPASSCTNPAQYPAILSASKKQSRKVISSYTSYSQTGK